MAILRLEESVGDLYATFRKKYPLEDVGLDSGFATTVRDKSSGRGVAG